MVKPLRALRVYGEGARLIREQGVLMVYRKWVQRPAGVEAGELVVVEDPRGEVLGCGLYDDHGPVAIRMVSTGYCDYSTVEELVLDRLEKAYRLRERLGLAGPDKGFRLVHADGDQLPGLIVDVYGELVVYQSSSRVWDVHAKTLVEAIVKVTGCKSVYEKSTQRTRLEIGLEPREGLRYGNRPHTVIVEGEVKLVVDPRRGQKTGLFLDQRDNRLFLARLVEDGWRVLDLFSYTGGFGLHALAHGAREVVFVECDEKALEMLRENLELNQLDKSRVRVIAGDVWQAVRRLRGHKERFDAVVVDPPAFIPSEKDREKGSRAYRHIYSHALNLLSRRGGLLFLSSCSAFLSVDEFRRIVAEVLSRAEYTVAGGVRGMPPDHPARPSAPYLDYLKSVFVLVHSPPR